MRRPSASRRTDPPLTKTPNAWGEKWTEFNATIRTAVAEWGLRAAAEGRVLAFENHQDFGSDELVAFCELGGPGVGITYDTGNSFPVGEAPLAFTWQDTLDG